MEWKLLRHGHFIFSRNQQKKMENAVLVFLCSSLIGLSLSKSLIKATKNLLFFLKIVITRLCCCDKFVTFCDILSHFVTKFWNTLTKNIRINVQNHSINIRSSSFSTSFFLLHHRSKIQNTKLYYSVFAMEVYFNNRWSGPTHRIIISLAPAHDHGHGQSLITNSFLELPVTEKRREILKILWIHQIQSL